MTRGKTAALINLMRRRGLEMPIVILVRRKRLEDIPVEVLDYIDGYIFLAEETPEFIAKVRSHGFNDLTLDKVIALKQAGVFNAEK